VAGGADESSGDEAGDEREDDAGYAAGVGCGFDVGDEPPTVMFLIVSPVTVKLYS